MKNEMITWLATKKIVLANDATEQQVLTGLQKAFTDAAAPVTTLANEKQTLGGQITALENEKTTLAGKVTALENERNLAQAGFKTERKARVTAIVDLAS